MSQDWKNSRGCVVIPLPTNRPDVTLTICFELFDTNFHNTFRTPPTSILDRDLYFYKTLSYRLKFEKKKKSANSVPCNFVYAQISRFIMTSIL